MKAIICCWDCCVPGLTAIQPVVLIYMLFFFFFFKLIWWKNMNGLTAYYAAAVSHEHISKVQRVSLREILGHGNKDVEKLETLVSLYYVAPNAMFSFGTTTLVNE